MRIFPILALVASLSACSRSLTVNETAAMSPFTGSDIQYSEVTVHRGGLASFKSDHGAVTLGNEIHWDPETYREDFLEPDNVIFIQDVALLAHELVHVWQYQNRATTGYSLDKLIDEHRQFGDTVYDFQTPLDPRKSFSSYRFEQQGAIVQEWVLLAAVGDPRADKYERVVRAAMPSLVTNLFKKLDLRERRQEP
jgi:hypothetical protein